MTEEKILLMIKLDVEAKKYTLRNCEGRFYVL